MSVEERRQDERNLPTRLVRLAIALGIGYLFLATFSPFFSVIA